MRAFFAALFALVACVSADAQLMTLGIGLGGKQAGATTTTFNPSYVGTKGTLSNGNLTWTSNAAGGNAATATIASHSSGVYFDEFTITDLMSGDKATIGFATAGLATFLPPGFDTTSIGYYQNGQVQLNGTVLTTLSTFTAGDVIDEYVDIGNLWFYIRKNGGNWNNNVSSNLSTGVGAISMSGIDAGPYYSAVSVSQFVSATSLTANFGATSYSFASPCSCNW